MWLSRDICEQQKGDPLDRGEDPISSSGGGQPTQYHVDCCCINCFLDVAYKYGVNVAFLMTKTRGGTCTRTSTDPTEDVLHGADFLLEHREFGAYDLSTTTLKTLQYIAKLACCQQ